MHPSLPAVLDPTRAGGGRECSAAGDSSEAGIVLGETLTTRAAGHGDLD